MSERSTYIGAFVFTETEMREALKWIKAQPTHNWRSGDVFIYHCEGSKHNRSIFKILSLKGQNSASVAQLWHGLRDEVGDKMSFVWFLPDFSMRKLLEVV